MTTEAIPLVLGVAWGALAATPFIRWTRRVTVVERLTPEVPTTRDAAMPARRRRSLHLTRFGPVGRVANGLVARRVAARTDLEIAGELPVVIDLLGVAVAAGCTPYLAIEVAARWAPPSLAARLSGVGRDCALGAGLEQALESLAASTPALSALVDALLASDRYGAPISDALTRLATEQRAALRRRAEARARTVPVRLLFPLVFLVLPAFALLTVVPALLAGLGRT